MQSDVLTSKILKFGRKSCLHVLRHVLPSERRCVQCSASPSDRKTLGAPRYAIVGAGAAGLATAWHLLALGQRSKQPISVDVYDVKGIAAGGSGAAAGLLHPFTPKGKLLWQGQAAMQAALELVEVAEAHASEPIVWRQGMVRPAANGKQAADFLAACSRHSEGTPSTTTGSRAGHASDCSGSDVTSASSLLAAVDKALRLECLTAEAARTLLPGLCVSDVDAARKGIKHTTRQPPRDGHGGVENRGSCAAMHVLGGVVVQPQRYLTALWAACQALAMANGGNAQLLVQKVTSLQELNSRYGPYDDVVVAAGAAIGSIQEIGDILPLDLCQGYTLTLAPKNSSAGWPNAAPSVLGTTYLAAQGPQQLVVGATQEHGWTAQQALQLCVEAQAEPDSASAQQAQQQLLETSGALWPPLVNWKLESIRSGVRAVPPRTALGSIPLAGFLPSSNCWLLVGLGARGLVYHAWLGSIVAAAMFAKDEKLLPVELLRWQAQNPMFGGSLSNGQ